MAQICGLAGPNRTITTACSSSATSLGYAADLIRYGYADVVVTGGADTFARLTHGGFRSLQARRTRSPAKPFDRRRKGLTIGEAAGILVFEEEDRARRRGARIRARFLGYGVTSDAHHMTQPEPTGATPGPVPSPPPSSAGLNPEDVDYVNAHGTATPQNDSAETAALKRALGDRAREIPVSSIKSMLGHCLCAAGAIEAVATVRTIETGLVPPTIHWEEPDPECDLDVVPNAAREVSVEVALSNSFAFGGNSQMVVAFGAWKPERLDRCGPPAAVVTGAGAVCPRAARLGLHRSGPRRGPVRQGPPRLPGRPRRPSGRRRPASPPSPPSRSFPRRRHDVWTAAASLHHRSRPASTCATRGGRAGRGGANWHPPSGPGRRECRAPHRVRAADGGG